LYHIEFKKATGTHKSFWQFPQCLRSHGSAIHEWVLICNFLIISYHQQLAQLLKYYFTRSHATLMYAHGSVHATL